MQPGMALGSRFPRERGWRRGPIRHLLGVVLIVASSLTVRADLVIVQKVEGGGQQGEMTIKIKDGKARADLAQPVSMITDEATGETIILQNSRKTFTRQTVEQTKALTQQLLAAQKGSDPPKLQDTGQKETIDGHETEIYTWTVGAVKMRFWVAKTYPNGAAIAAELDRLQNSGLASVAASMMPKASDLPGVRLRTEIAMAAQKVTSTVVSIKQETVDPEVFTIPKDFTESSGGGSAE